MLRHACFRGAPGSLVAGVLPVPEVPQRPMDGGEGEVVPGDLVPGEEPDLETLGTRLEAGLSQSCSVDHLDLADPGNVIDREQALDRDAGAGFLEGLARGTGHRRLVHLEIPRGQRPVAAPRLDRALAE